MNSTKRKVEALIKSDFVVRMVFGSGVEHPTESKIRRFKRLKNGWHHGRGTAFTEDILNAAIKVHTEIVSSGYFDTDSFPGIDGEIQISVYDLPQSYEVTLEKDGRWHLVSFNDGKECFECSGTDAICVVPMIISPWNISTSYLGNSGSQNTNDLQALPSSPLLMEAESLSLKSDARKTPQEASAHISESSTQMSQRSQISFGTSRRILYESR